MHQPFEKHRGGLPSATIACREHIPPGRCRNTANREISSAENRTSTPFPSFDPRLAAKLTTPGNTYRVLQHGSSVPKYLLQSSY
jgi:hypothetical protein